MIRTKKDLRFYIIADRVMNGYPASLSLKNKVKELFFWKGGKALIIKYLFHLRRYGYYLNNQKKLLSFNTLMLWIELRKLSKLAIKCGFSIGPNALGYGVVIPHYGTIVVNDNARIGNYALLHTCTCIAGGDKQIGDGLYLATGSQIVGHVTLGDGVTVAAHSLVNKSFCGHCLVVGAPASVKKENQPVWYETERDRMFSGYVSQVEMIKKKMYGMPQ